MHWLNDYGVLSCLDFGFFFVQLSLGLLPQAFFGILGFPLLIKFLVIDFAKVFEQVHPLEGLVIDFGQNIDAFLVAGSLAPLQWSHALFVRLQGVEACLLH